VAASTVSKVTVSGLTPGVCLWGKVIISKGNKVVATSDPYYIMVV